MRQWSKGIVVLALLIAACVNAWGWGGTAHRFVNRNAVMHLPSSMAVLSAQQTFLANHASDADNRKSADTAESPKHFLDIESYPDFAHLPSDLSTLISRYGWPNVKANGILPWATVWALDSMTAQLRRGDTTKAYQSAADLGHYVADAHQPLHCTVNYDGYQTGNNGIHSRYETKMIDAFQSSLSITADTARFVDDPYAYALEYILRANAYADSIMMADDSAKAGSGWTGSGTPPQLYYTILWEKTRRFTSMLLQESTVSLASLWYTAWVNAGLSDRLPLQLASFTAVTLPGSQVRLSWSTLSEVDNLGFEVQKSSDSTSNFQTIPGSFQAGHGTTTERWDYSYTDTAAPPHAVTYYRLKQTDGTGVAHYSDPIAVASVTSIAGNGQIMEYSIAQNYPNPFNPTTTIAYSVGGGRAQGSGLSDVRLVVYDVLGREVAVLVNERKAPGTYTVRFSAKGGSPPDRGRAGASGGEGSGLASGVYIYSLTAGSFSQARTMLLVK